MKDASRQRRRAALHLRPCNQRRPCAGWPQGERDHPLGQRRLTRSTPRFGSTITCSACPIPTTAPEGKTWLDNINPNSLEVLKDAKLEPSLATASGGDLPFQFERSGYFYADPVDSKPGKPVFNRTVTLKDTWAKVQKKGK